MCAELRAIPELACGYNAVGFSQGGQFLRVGDQLTGLAVGFFELFLSGQLTGAAVDFLELFLSDQLPTGPASSYCGSVLVDALNV